MNYTDFGNIFEDERSGEVFGEKGQVVVLGWTCRNGSGRKLYLVHCTECAKDKELFGDGVFSSYRNNLVKGQVACGCSKKPLWSKEQLTVRLKRKADALGYTFISFSEEYNKALTKISISCSNHGVWEGTAACNFLSGQSGCPKCATESRVSKLSVHNTKPDDYFISKFYETGEYDNVNNFKKVYIDEGAEYSRHMWSYTCGDCGLDTTSYAHVLLSGGKSCDCSSRSQKEAYIKLLKDLDSVVAIKFGIANKASQRKIKNCVYEIEDHSYWTFDNRVDCIKAETTCKNQLTCSVLPKTEVPDGYTETTSPLNIERVIEIFKSFGGKPLEVFV